MQVFVEGLSKDWLPITLVGIAIFGFKQQALFLLLCAGCFFSFHFYDPMIRGILLGKTFSIKMQIKSLGDNLKKIRLKLP